MTAPGPRRGRPWSVVRDLMKGAPAPAPEAPFPGRPVVVDGGTAVVEVEDAACGRARRTLGARSADERDAWAAAITAGLSMSGVRAATLSGGQGVAAMHEALYAAAGKRLAYVVNIASRAVTKQAASTHAGHDDYHAVDDTGLFQLFARDTQAAADLTLIAHRIAELALTPGLVAQDAFLTSHLLASVRMPEAGLVREYLGDPADHIESPTPAQRLVYGDTRRRIPELFDLDYPAMLGAAQDPDSYAQGVAAQRPFYFDHVAELADRAMAEYAGLTGRAYARAQGYRLDDAQYVLVGQGSIVPTCEAICDHLRATARLKVGVLDLTMFRPFPADLVSALLAGRKAVTVLERVDQPLAVDPPLLREIRATMSKALENGRSQDRPPHAGITPCRPAQLPDFFSGCFGLGSRDVQPADLVAAVRNMRAGTEARRQFYLGIDFVRPGTRLPKLQVWQEQLVDRYPQLAGLALEPAEAVDLRPAGAMSVRVDAARATDAEATGRRLARLAADVFGLHVRAHPSGGVPAAGDPFRFDLTLAAEPVRVGGALKRVSAVIATDPRVLDGPHALDGLDEGGVLLVDAPGGSGEAWAGLSDAARRVITGRKLRTSSVDSRAIAAGSMLGDRAPDAVRVGAFLKASGMVQSSGLAEQALFDRIGERLAARVGAGPAADEYVRLARRGFADAVALDPAAMPPVTGEPAGRVPVMPSVLGGTNVQPGIAHGGRFWERVGVLRELGQDGLADPFAALGAVPAATSAIRDMTTVRLEVPELVPDRCTGCGECWVQCPDTAIPGVVTDVGELLDAAVRTVEADRPCDRLRQVLKPLTGETRRQLKAATGPSFADVLSASYATVADKLGFDPERRQALDAEFAAVHAAMADFPVARTEAFFDAHEQRAKGTGGLLSVTVDPTACKGCNICVTVCPEDALRMVPQTAEVIETLQRNWTLWQQLPETDDRYVAGPDQAATPDALPSLLLRQSVYRSMVGGDVVGPGSTEKTALHLVLSAVKAFVLPRVARHLTRLTELIDGLDAKARELLASDARFDAAESLKATGGTLAIPLEKSKHERVEWIATLLRELKDLRWRYAEGPAGRGRAACGITGATDSTTAWGGTYPYNPYPFPWASHLLQDAPSVALGLFEGQMRKMARGFAWVRRAELELEDAYDAEEHEPVLAALDWRQFTDEEFALCPPLLAVGGDRAMVDAGFQHLSHLLVSGRPVRIVVLDAEGAVERAPAAAGEVGKNLALLAIAHRHAFVLQSSPAAPSHLLGGVLRGLEARRPAVFSIHCPHVPAHGTDRSAAVRAAKLALESRAFPAVVYDPAAGSALADRLSLDANPAPDDPWPSYELAHLDESGEEQALKLPVTIADWAATEAGFAPAFSRPDASTDEASLRRFDEYLAAPPDEREGLTPFIHVLEEDRRLGRLLVGTEIVRLAEERLQCWRELRQMAGLELAGSVRERVARDLQAGFDRRLKDLESRHQTALADLQSRYPVLIARRLVEGLVRAAGDGTESVGDLLRRAATATISPLPVVGDGNGDAPEAPAIPAAPVAAAAPPPAAAPPAAEEAPPAADEDADESVSMDPYIQSALCTTCDECININKRMFAYNKKKQAYIKDPRAGTFRELVLAAQKCPVAIIHPGTPLNPDEKDLDKWVEAAARFM